jgi:hypothetical protein
MVWRVLSYVFLVTALILFAVAGYGYYLDTDTHGAALLDPEREFPGLAVGENTVTFRVHNPTRHTVRIVGFSSC